MNSKLRSSQGLIIINEALIGRGEANDSGKIDKGILVVQIGKTNKFKGKFHQKF